MLASLYGAFMSVRLKFRDEFRHIASVEFYCIARWRNPIERIAKAGNDTRIGGKIFIALTERFFQIVGERKQRKEREYRKKAALVINIGVSLAEHSQGVGKGKR